MALGRLLTFLVSSSTLLLLLLVLVPPSECSQLVGDATHHMKMNGRNSNVIGTSPFICKTSCSVNSNRRSTLTTFSLKPFINPRPVVTAVTVALLGSVSIGVFWMLFSFLYLKALNNLNAFTAVSSDEEGDDFNDEYGILSRRRIRTQNQWAKSSACYHCAASELLTVGFPEA